jgi:hypothetical protein
MPDLFRSFWMGGFECSTHINRHGQRLDMIAAVQHDVRAEEDYALLASMGLMTARDGVRWNLIDRGGQYDWSSFLPLLKASLSNGVQVIWDLCHYGFPDDLDLLEPAFVDRFAKYAGAAARVFRDHTDETPFWTPINEISFFTWAASRDFMFPCAFGCDNAIKRQLVRAAIAASEAIWDVDARARFVYPEPILNAVAPAGRPDLQAIARRDMEFQYEGWDMLAGYKSAGLGGAPKYLDIPGANFYFNNQWEERNRRVVLRWLPNERDPHWAPLSQLLMRLYHRYRRPILLAETGHFGAGRALWLNEIATQAHRAQALGVPLEGVCLYPILDRYDWDNHHHWHNAGLWDLEAQADGSIRRVLCTEYAEELRRAQSQEAVKGACGG